MASTALAYDEDTGLAPLTLDAEQQARWDAFIACLLDGRNIKVALAASSCTWGGVQQWMARQPALHDEYARAREQSSDIWADRAVREAFRPALDGVQVQHARLKSDVAKWRAAVQSPRWSEQKANQVNVQVNVTANSLHMDSLRQRSVLPDKPR